MCGWTIQSRRELNLSAGRGAAVRELALQMSEADYLLFVDRKVVGVIEAKPVLRLRNRNRRTR